MKRGFFLFWSSAFLGLLALPYRSVPAQVEELVVRVGTELGDIRGKDHRAIQAAIDYVAGLGGGTVVVEPGRYLLRNAVTLRDRVRLKGTPGKTILVMCRGQKTDLAKDVYKKDHLFTLKDSEGFQIGDGIALEDKAGHGFEVSTATITAKMGPKTFQLSPPVEGDYLVKRSAVVRLAFPMVAGWNIKNALVEGLTLEGNYQEKGTEYLGGCRGGGIYFHGCENVVVRNCTVRHYNGDAISFQKKCKNITIEDCLVEENANVGLHPGSYSHDCLVRNNTIRKNGYVGLFVCVGVKKVTFADNQILHNKGCGISIGFDDTDNLFRGNQVIGNAEMGVLFRRDSLEHGGHRNVFEKNTILDNLGPRPAKSNSRPESAGKASVVIEGHHHDLVFRDNVFGFAKAHSGPAILFDEGVRNLVEQSNRLVNVRTILDAFPIKKQ